MDDLEPDFSDIDFLPGVDLYLWLRLVLALVALLGAGALLVTL